MPYKSHTQKIHIIFEKTVLTKVLPAWMKGDSLKCKDSCAPTFYRYISNTQFRRCQASQWKRKDISEGRSKNLGSRPPSQGAKERPRASSRNIPHPQGRGIWQCFPRGISALLETSDCLPLPCFLFFEKRVSFGYVVLLLPLSMGRAEDLFLAPRCPDQKQTHIDLT